ncbi:hypothetical protein DPMN_113986 [Dreissena polymorpha]|uniref:Uncharacterized protein n=1 Tax=Dreissena polymorpha TaxID=45954 RepID=A0A9D4KK06_DREPO|nr:hypothetical protein DPMN_113986 [Dreissena polymorpha]
MKHKINEYVRNMTAAQVCPQEPLLTTFIRQSGHGFDTSPGMTNCAKLCSRTRKREVAVEIVRRIAIWKM